MNRPFGETTGSAPNFHQRQLPRNPGEAWIDAAIWWDDGTSGTAINVFRAEGDDPSYSLSPGLALRWARNTHEFNEMGLRPTLSAIGVETSTYASDEDPNGVGYIFTSLPTETLIERANALQYPAAFGSRMRFETTDEAVYSIDKFFGALQEGRMLISMNGNDPWLHFHDIADHMFVGLALSGELVDVLSVTARRLMSNPETHPDYLEKGAEKLRSEFLGNFDKRLFSTTFLSFLREDEAELTAWASMLSTDMDTVRGYAVRTRQQLRELQPLPTWQPPRQRAGWLAGRLSLGRRS